MMLKKLSVLTIVLILFSSLTYAGFFSSFFETTGALAFGGETCHDNDAGRYDMSTASYVSLVGVNYYDLCTKNGLLEASCGEVDNLVYKLYPCYNCEDGKCTDAEVKGEELEGECFDSDGEDITQAGQVKVLSDDNDYIFEDFCKDDKNLVEFTCEDDRLVPKVVSCAECVHGECKTEQQDCVDSDSGVDRYNAGVVDFNGETYADFCEDEKTLLEYSCRDGEVDKVEINCHYGCKDDKCKLKTLDFLKSKEDTVESEDRTTLLLKRIESVVESIDEKTADILDEDTLELESEEKDVDSRLDAVLRVLRVVDSRIDLLMKEDEQRTEETEKVTTRERLCVVNNICEEDLGEDSENCPEDCGDKEEICSVVNFDFDEDCDGGYEVVKFECTDGYVAKEEAECRSEEEWKQVINEICAEHCELFEEDEELPAYCGDGVCQPQESMVLCPADCLTTSGEVVVCGDGTCDERFEDSLNCREDCGAGIDLIKARIKLWIAGLS
jgi:hypothetical protein